MIQWVRKTGRVIVNTMSLNFYFIKKKFGESPLKITILQIFMRMRGSQTFYLFSKFYRGIHPCILGRNVVTSDLNGVRCTNLNQLGHQNW